jgi:hypothetical protein
MIRRSGRVSLSPPDCMFRHRKERFAGWIAFPIWVGAASRPGPAHQFRERLPRLAVRGRAVPSQRREEPPRALPETAQPLHRFSTHKAPRCRDGCVTVTHLPRAGNPPRRHYLSYKESLATNFTDQGKNGSGGCSPTTPRAAERQPQHPAHAGRAGELEEPLFAGPVCCSGGFGPASVQNA